MFSRRRNRERRLVASRNGVPYDTRRLTTPFSVLLSVSIRLQPSSSFSFSLFGNMSFARYH